MKPLVTLLLLMALAVFFLVAQSFQSSFFETIYSPEFPARTPTTPEPGGGSPRKIQPVTTVSSSNPTGFRGPSGTPHIIGPTTPPPGP